MPLTIDRFHRGDEKEILALFSRVFGEKRGEEHWLWENMANPRGKSVFALLKENGLVRGQLCLHASLFHVKGKKMLSGQRINSMLEAGYRQRGYYKEMFAKILELAGERGFSFTYGFPNEQALRALQKVCPVKEIARVPRLIKIYDARGGAARILGENFAARAAGHLLNPLLRMKQAGLEKNRKGKGKYSVSAITHFDRGFDELWEETSGAMGVATVRDSDYLNWRYIRAPRNYRVLACREGGRLRGYLVLLLEQDGGTAHLLDLLAQGNDPEVTAALLSGADEYLKDQCSLFSCWCLDRGEVSEALKKHGFFKIKSGARLVFANISCPPATEEFLLNSDNWYAMLGDSDYF